MDDGRTYDYVVALRAMQTSDLMIADRAELPYALLNKVSSRILNLHSSVGLPETCAN